MKKLSVMVGLTIAVAVLGLAQIGCTKAADNKNATTSTATPEATPDKAAIEAELTKIESDWPRIIKEHDADAVQRIEADDLVEVSPEGAVATKAQDIADIRAGNMSTDSWDVLEIKVTVLDSNAAFATGRSVIKGGKVKGSDGKTMDISGEYRWLDTFARRDGQWKLVASSIVKIQPGGTAPAAKPSPSPTASPSPKPSPSAKASPTAKASPAAKPAAATSPVKTKTP